MAIELIHIKNFKSLVDLKIEKPSPFTVFVGPNASGKSNIFEALSFFTTQLKYDVKTGFSLFGGQENFLNKNYKKHDLTIKYYIDNLTYSISNPVKSGMLFNLLEADFPLDRPISEIDKSIRSKYFINFNKYFIGNIESNEPRSINSDYKLSSDGSNLELVLKRKFADSSFRDELLEWVHALIPGLSDILINFNQLTGNNDMLVYEKDFINPFPKKLISNGTINIISLLTSVLQFEDEQFLCIEEPENGLHPEAIKELVYFFREQCEKKGHYIWLTTHSQSLVSVLKPEEIIAVDKINGETKIKQYIGENFHGLKMDEAWLSNVLGGGLI
jgi:predicted ATPase